jgi:hypothetical protein
MMMMMKIALRVVALFVGYSAIGFGGDYVVSLFAGEDRGEAVRVRAPEVVVDVESNVVVDVLPTIVSRIQIRRGGACEFEVDRELAIGAAGVDVLHIDAGAGALHVEGQDGLQEIVVVGTLCASNEDALEGLQLTLDESANGDVTVVAHYPEERGGRHDGAKIDLTVLMPVGMSVDIDDSSGEMEVSGTGDLTIDDSSGSISVSDVRGSLNIDDGSGGLSVLDVIGDVRIEDGSGGVDVSGVEGSLHVRDGSGGIEISNVAQNVVIENDGSGGIDVDAVGGDFVVERDGSGGIRHANVQGRVDIPVKDRRGGD